jgi:hypothetical protein
MSLAHVRELPSPDRDDGAVHRLDSCVALGIRHPCVCMLRKSYSPKCLEGEFSEVRFKGMLRSCARSCNPSYLSSLINWEGLIPESLPSGNGGNR